MGTECAFFGASIAGHQAQESVVRLQRAYLGLLQLLMILAMLWSYWPCAVALEQNWATNPRYSHGYLVPLFSLYLCWSRWGYAGSAPPQPSPMGIFPISLGIAMQILGAATNYEWIESASLLPLLVGLCVLTAGWPALRQFWPAIAFLLFMIPLPYRVEGAISGPLQTLATDASAVLLQLAGLPALKMGNTIALGHSTIGVVEACNGLSMLTFFLAISIGLVLCSRRALVEQILIIAGAVPIAVIANTTRITATGLLLEQVGHDFAGIEFHDLAGYLMMPFALLLLGVENTLIVNLFRGEQSSSRRSDALFGQDEAVPDGR